MKTKVGIIGRGHVGRALERAFDRAGHEVRTAGQQPGAVREVGAWAEVLVLAVPFRAIDLVMDELGDTVLGKTLVDVTNALAADMQLALGCTTSGAEELQVKAPGAKVVKAFNTVFAQHMERGHVKGERLTLFVAADDAAAKERVLGLGRDVGFDAVDAGPLRNARWLETLGYFNIQLGYAVGLGTEIGFRLVR